MNTPVVEGVLGVVRITALYYKRHQLLERNREAGNETELTQQMQPAKHTHRISERIRSVWSSVCVP